MAMAAWRTLLGLDALGLALTSFSGLGHATAVQALLPRPLSGRGFAGFRPVPLCRVACPRWMGHPSSRSRYNAREGRSIWRDSNRSPEQAVKGEEIPKEVESGSGKTAGHASANHTFFAVGSWNNWDFAEMVSDSTDLEAGTLHVDVILSQEEEEFQIVVDQDWDQVLHPPEDAPDGCEAPQPAAGPDDEGHGLNWLLKGRAGEAFRIELRRRPGGSGAVVEGLQAAWWVSSRKLAGSMFEYNDPGLMLAICAKSGNWQWALVQLREMRTWGEDILPMDFGAAIRACGRSSAWEAALALLQEQWGRERQSQEPAVGHYVAVAEACLEAGETELAASLVAELEEWGPRPDKERFQLTPRVFWNRDVRRMGCSVKNTLDWQGGDPMPMPETRPCWLLPASDKLAVEIAERREALQKLGWRVFSCEPRVVSRLDNKDAFQRFAAALGLSEHLPEWYDSPEDASYPCILKPAAGEFGRDTSIVRSFNDVLYTLKDEDWSDAWVLQELVLGRFEYSTSLLAQAGEILEVACTRYEYEKEEYVWPKVRELGKELCEVPPEHLAIMKALLQDYTGICNFNYKVRACGRMCIFEANARVGADLACDVPRLKARSIFERLDSLVARGA